MSHKARSLHIIVSQASLPTGWGKFHTSTWSPCPLLVMRPGGSSAAVAVVVAVVFVVWICKDRMVALFSYFIFKNPPKKRKSSKAPFTYVILYFTKYLNTLLSNYFFFLSWKMQGIIDQALLLYRISPKFTRSLTDRTQWMWTGRLIKGGKAHGEICQKAWKQHLP